MITGRRLFAGDSISETLAGVLTSEPDLTAIPPNVRRLLRSCLEKDPRRRLHDISDARLLLDSAPALETPPAPAKRRWVPWATAALMTAALAGTNAFWLTRPAPERRTSRFSLTAPSGTQFAANTTAAVSPDGRHVVFAAVSQSGRSLWLQSLESATARPLPFGEDANWPSWSPDSRSLVFVNGASGQIKRAGISGDAPQLLCDPVANAPMGPVAWSRDGVILMASTTGLYRLPDSGGVPQRLSEPDASRGETAFAFPQFLEDGKRFIFHIQSSNPNTEGVYLGSLDRPEQRHRILASRDKGIYVAPRDGRPAYLMFLRDQTLVVQRFNVDAGKLEGDPLHVADNLPTSPSMREGFWLSESGLLVFGTGGSGVKRRLLWIARDGKREEAVPEGLYQSLRLSPDGKEVALDAAAAVEDIWRLEFARGVRTKVTSDPRRDVVPAWSPDGRQLAYMSNRTGTFQLYRRDARGDGDRGTPDRGAVSEVPDRLDTRRALSRVLRDHREDEERPVGAAVEWRSKAGAAAHDRRHRAARRRIP